MAKNDGFKHSSRVGLRVECLRMSFVVFPPLPL